MFSSDRQLAKVSYYLAKILCKAVVITLDGYILEACLFFICFTSFFPASTKQLWTSRHVSIYDGILLNYCLIHLCMCLLVPRFQWYCANSEVKCSWRLNKTDLVRELPGWVTIWGRQLLVIRQKKYIHNDLTAYVNSVFIMIHVNRVSLYCLEKETKVTSRKKG